MCGTNDQTVQAPGNVVIDGVASGESPGGTGSCALHINKLARQASEFALHSVLIWDVGLTKVEMKLVTDQLTAQLKGPVVQDWEGVVSSERLQSFLAANPPASAYFGKDYNADQGRLRDRSGNHRHAVVSGNGAEVASAEGDGGTQRNIFSAWGDEHCSAVPPPAASRRPSPSARSRAGLRCSLQSSSAFCRATRPARSIGFTDIRRTADAGVLVQRTMETAGRRRTWLAGPPQIGSCCAEPTLRRCHARATSCGAPVPRSRTPTADSAGARCTSTTFRSSGRTSRCTRCSSGTGDWRPTR